MGYLIKEATPAWAAQLTAKILAVHNIVPTASKYGSKVVKAYNRMKARGTLSQPFQVPAEEIGTYVRTSASKKAPKTFIIEPLSFNDALMRFDATKAPPVSTRYGLAISRVPRHSHSATGVTSIRGANNEEYIRMLDETWHRPAEIKLTGNPILDDVAWVRSLGKAMEKPKLTKRYKGRILDQSSFEELERTRNHPGFNAVEVMRMKDDMRWGNNASYLFPYKAVAVPKRISKQLFNPHGGYNVAKEPLIRKAILDHENLGHASMSALPAAEANKISQRYYMAIKQLDKYLSKNTTGYKPLSARASDAWGEGIDQAYAALQSKAIRMTDKRFLENANVIPQSYTVIPKHEMEALGSVTKQQAFGPNTNISDELFEAARAGLLQMRRGYRFSALG